jgi:thiamine-phosphate pyrophosphorylase
MICVITDRRRLCPNGTASEQLHALVEQGIAAARADVDLLQVRERDLADRELFDTVNEILHAVRGSRLRVLVNDRPDIAIGAGAHGVHLRGDGMGTADVRSLGADLLVGRSVHDVEEARRAAAAGAGFVIFGTVFPSGSKAPGHPVAGISALSSVVRACSVPVLAVGGITPDNVRAIATAGVAGVAAIGWLATRDPRSMQSAVDACRKAFGEVNLSR